MVEWPTPPELPGAESEHYALFRRVGILRFYQLGFAEPKKLYDRLELEVARVGFDVRLPSRDVVAEWINQSQGFTNEVWSMAGPKNVKVTMFRLPARSAQTSLVRRFASLQ